MRYFVRLNVSLISMLHPKRNLEIILYTINDLTIKSTTSVELHYKLEKDENGKFLSLIVVFGVEKLDELNFIGSKFDHGTELWAAAGSSDDGSLDLRRFAKEDHSCNFMTLAELREVIEEEEKHRQ